MDDVEWRTLVSDINSDIAGIVHAEHARRILEDVNLELAQRADEPIEEDFIDADAWNIDPAGPSIVVVDGVTIRTRKLHRRGLTQADVKGADLLYEIEGLKFVLIQYKKPDHRGRVERDSGQLDDLIEACPNPCPPHRYGFEETCGAWFAVTPNSPESAYLPACVTNQIFGKADSRKKEKFTSVADYTKDGFQRAFAECQIGARLTPIGFKMSRARIERERIKQDRVLFSVSQSGSFTRIR
jgi:hypothetical protein